MLSLVATTSRVSGCGCSAEEGIIPMANMVTSVRFPSAKRPPPLPRLGPTGPLLSLSATVSRVYTGYT